VDERSLTACAYSEQVEPSRCLAALAALAVGGAMLLAGPAAQAGPVAPDIVNGRDPEPGEIKALVYVRAGGYSCGGTLVDATHVVTAAHCAVSGSGVPLSPGRVTVGWANSTSFSVIRMHFVDRVFVHPDYDPTTLDNDIAVLELTQAIPGATPMRVTTVQESTSALAAGGTVKSAGYGNLTSTGPASDVVRVADMTVLPDAVCADDAKSYKVGGVTFWGMGVDTDHSLCAIGVKSANRDIIDTCQGDSGGPLFSGTTPEVLLGVVSSGVGCAGFDNGRPLSEKTPGVYTRLATYLPWLAEVGVDTGAGAPDIPGAPTITSTRQTGTAGELLVTVAPSDKATVLGYWIKAVNVDDSSDIHDCTTAETACTLANLVDGATYSISVSAFGETDSSPDSAPVIVTMDFALSAPVKPAITKGWDRGEGRVKLKVKVGNQPVGTNVYVTCTSSKADGSAKVKKGYANLRLKAGARYTCRAYAENDLGLARSSKFTFRLPAS